MTIPPSPYPPTAVDVSEEAVQQIIQWAERAGGGIVDDAPVWMSNEEASAWRQGVASACERFVPLFLALRAALTEAEKN